MRLPTLAAVTLAAATLAATPAGAARDAKQWTKSWDVGGNPSISVVTNDARVLIHRGAPGKVETKITYSLRTWGLASGAHDPKVVLEQDGNTVRIEAREASNIVVFGGVESKFEMNVTVPANCELSVRSTDGSITCDPLEGRISLESRDGRIHASGLRGTLVLWSADGGVDADSLDGSLMAHTGDGHLKVAGRFDHLDVRTQDGRLEATILPGSQPAAAWSLETGDGSMVVRIPRNLQALLDASSRDGSLRVDLPVTTKGAIRNNALHGELNGGSVPMRLRSGDGSITLALSE
jgi:hypothetical protein